MHQHSLRIRKTMRFIAFGLTPTASLLIMALVDISPGHPAATRMIAVALLMAVWWITEVVSLSVTALLPVVLFPLLGITDGKSVASVYFNHIIFLFIGGFLVAIAMQKWNLHKRIALKLLTLTGTGPVRLLIGFMTGTWFLSMWMSNTATTMMMLPILLSVIAELDTLYGKVNMTHFASGLLLALAYSSSIGGIATLIGTPPNPIFLRIYQINFPQGSEVNFANWFFFAFPLSVIIMLTLFGLIYFKYIYHHNKQWQSGKPINFANSYRQLGKAGAEEKRVLLIFILLALLWMTRSPIKTGSFSIPGWSLLFPHPDFFNDGTVSMAMGLLLFLIPAKSKGHKTLLTWSDTQKLPWGIIILFGGGFALAEGFKSSGLSLALGQMLSGVAAIPPLALIFLITTLMVFLTELTSNSSSTVIILPILASLAQGTGINPLLLMIPATISASMAFMLPVATPPNAIVFGSRRLNISHMSSTGLILNLIVIVLVSLWSFYLTPLFF